MDVKRAVQGSILAAAAMIAGSAEASQVIQQQCELIPIPGPPDCGCDNCDQDTPPNPPHIVCYPGPTTSQEVCENITVEELTTPLSIARYTNGSDYQYTAAAPDVGYWFQAHAFSLANDGYEGAVPLYSMSDGKQHALMTDPSEAPGWFIEEQLGYIFPTTNNGFIPLYQFADPLRDDSFYTVNPVDADQLPCPSPAGTYNYATMEYTPPDCYFNYAVVGYCGT
jgi:hypothetical protein